MTSTGAFWNPTSCKITELKLGAALAPDSMTAVNGSAALSPHANTMSACCAFRSKFHTIVRIRIPGAGPDRGIPAILKGKSVPAGWPVPAEVPA